MSNLSNSLEAVPLHVHISDHKGIFNIDNIILTIYRRCLIFKRIASELYTGENVDALEFFALFI